jgi:enoyl-[acyl-carrier protein] reductase I
VSTDGVGGATAFLAHDAARLVTGDVASVGAGYHVVD